MWLSVSSSAKYYTCLSALPVYPFLCLSIPFITIYFFFLSFFLLSLPYLAIFSFFHAIRSFFLAFVLSSLLFSYHFLKFHPISVLSFIFSFFLFFLFLCPGVFLLRCVCVCVMSVFWQIAMYILHSLSLLIASKSLCRTHTQVKYGCETVTSLRHC